MLELIKQFQFLTIVHNAQVEPTKWSVERQHVYGVKTGLFQILQGHRYVNYVYLENFKTAQVLQTVSFALLEHIKCSLAKVSVIFAVQACMLQLLEPQLV